MAQGEGSRNDTTTRMAAMTTVTEDRLQERSNDKRTRTSLQDIVRLLTVRLRLILLVFFSHGSKAGTTTTRRDPTTTRVEEVAAALCNGIDYSCDVSTTTAASTDSSDTESTTSADTDRLHPSTFPIADNDVDLINPLLADYTHYICMITAGAGLNLPQARLLQPTVSDGTTPPFQECIQELATSSASTTTSSSNRWVMQEEEKNKL